MSRTLPLRTVLSLFTSSERAAAECPLPIIQGLRKTLLCSVFNISSCRGFAARTPAAGRLRGTQADVDAETAAHLHPRTKAQRVFAGRVERALANTVNFDVKLRSALVEPYGFVVRAVRVTDDRRSATVLWDCRRYPLSVVDVCGLALKRYGNFILRQLAQALGAPHVPKLSWRHAALGSEDQHALGVIQQLQDEREREDNGSPTRSDARRGSDSSVRSRSRPRSRDSGGAAASGEAPAATEAVTASQAQSGRDARVHAAADDSGGGQPLSAGISAMGGTSSPGYQQGSERGSDSPPG